MARAWHRERETHEMFDTQRDDIEKSMTDGGVERAPQMYEARMMGHSTEWVGGEEGSGGDNDDTLTGDDA